MHLNKSSLPPLRRFCFHQCMSVCLLTQDYSKTVIKYLWNFPEWLDIILGPIEWPWAKGLMFADVL